MEVKRIPATRPAGKKTSSKADSPKLRVAAYCRVSTEMEEQESSYEAQVSHYTEYIRANPAWVLAGIFADEGISGTGTARREAFNRMISDCKDGKIDMIITKSISRFARNTLDCLRFIRMLKDLGIPIYFEKENINSMDARGEVMLTIMASLAQQESQSISENVRLGIRYQYQQGKVRVNHTWFLGYTKDADGQLVIVPEQAEVVRRIYREFLDGKSIRKIAADLEKDGIKTGAGRTKWYDSTVRSVLTNEKYMGDALLQKSYTVDFLTKKRARNNGKLPQYYVENDHEPIISREIFQRTQGELQRRANNYSESGMREGYSCKFALTGRLICDKCGSSYRRIKANGSNKYTTWRCKKRLMKGAPCDGRIVREDDVQAAVLAAMNDLAASKESYALRQQALLEGPLTECTEILEALDEKIADLQEKNSLSQTESRELGQLKRQKRIYSEKKAAAALEEAHLAQILAFIQGQEADGQFKAATEYREAEVLKLLDRVRVLEDAYLVCFKNGEKRTVRQNKVCRP